MKRQDKKTQNEFIERCKKIAMLSKYFETHECEIDADIAVRPHDDHSYWVHKCIEIAKDPELIDTVEYSPMCGVSIAGIEIPTNALFNSTHEMLTTLVRSYLKYWRNALLCHAEEMSEAINYMIFSNKNAPNKDVLTEHDEIMYYNDRIGWLMGKYESFLDPDIDLNEIFKDLEN